jgi:hypothetical protein
LFIVIEMYSTNNNILINLQGWYVVGEELFHIVCENEVENQQ